MSRLSNRTAFVTGAAMGNGLGAVKAMARDGARVVMADKNEIVFDTASALQSEGFDVLPVLMDVTDKAGIEEAVQKAVGHYGGIDILVNNAGVSILTRFMDRTQDIMDLHFNVNLFGVWNCCRAVLPHMVRQNYGKIINISSVTGQFVSDEGYTAYGTTKSALIGLTKCLAVEFAPQHINVNAICPGYIHTPMVDDTARQTDPVNPQRVIDSLAQNIPLKRMGTPDEIGDLVAFLASGESSYITGSVIVIDGGALIPETGVVGV